MKTVSSILNKFSKACVMRSPREKNVGLAKLFLPGLEFTPFAAGRLVLGFIGDDELVSPINLCSKSQDEPSEDEIKRISANPAVPAFVMAHLARIGYVSEIQDTETYLGNPIGLVGSGIEDKLSAEAAKLNIRAFALEKFCLLEKNAQGIFMPADLGDQVISFDQQARSQDLIDEQDAHLKQKYDNWILQKAKRGEDLVSLELRKHIANSMIERIQMDIYTKAKSINPQYRKRCEDVENPKKESQTRAVEVPNTSLRNEAESRRLTEASNAFYEGKNYNLTAGFD